MLSVMSALGLGTRWCVPVVALLAVLAMPQTAAADVAAGQSTHTIVSGGVERSYVLYVPAGVAGRAIPLVLNFHGSGGVPQNQITTSGFDDLADREGFAVAYPAGIFENKVSRRSWNANAEPGADDVQLARDVIDDVSAQLQIDASRIYATGFSGGARMTSRLVMRAPPENPVA